MTTPRHELEVEPPRFAEETLQLDDAVLAEALAAAPVAMALVEARKPFRVLWANESFAGWSRSDVRGSPLEALFPGAEEQDLIASLRHVALGGEPTTVYVSKKQPSGTKFAELHISYVHPGGAAGMLLVVEKTGRNEPSQKVLNEDRRLIAILKAMTRRSKAFDEEDALAAATEAAFGICEAPVAVFLSGPDRSLRLAASTGLDSISFPVPESLPRGEFQTIWRALETGRRYAVPYVPSLDREERLLLQAARAVWLVSFPLVGHRKVLGVLLTLWRQRVPGPTTLEALALVCQQTASAIEHAWLYREVQEADRRKEEFLAVLSHELRTPLTPLLAWAEMLRRAPNLSQVQHAAEVIERNVLVQRDLINELLDLAALSRDKLVLNPSVLDLRDVVFAAFETLIEHARQKEVRVAWSMCSEPLPVLADPSRLQQIFWNLLSNAIKFTPRNGTVTVATSRAGTVAVARIEDMGEGIAPEFLPHIFEMFKQQEEGTRRTHGGLGIGLAVAKRLTELHRGSIEAVSAGPGLGAAFAVRFPLHGISTQTLRAPVADNGEKRTDLTNLTVLIVEDDVDVREALELMIQQLGATTVLVQNGREALAKLASLETGVVLCDLSMPVMDGYDFIAALREDARYAGLPVIAVSGFGDKSVQLHARKMGFDECLCKPVEREALVAAIRRALRSRGSARAEQVPDVP